MINTAEDFIELAQEYAALGGAIQEQLNDLYHYSPKDEPSKFNKNALDNYIRPFLETLRDDYNLDIQDYQWWEDDDDWPDEWSADDEPEETN